MKTPWRTVGLIVPLLLSLLCPSAKGATGMISAASFNVLNGQASQDIVVTGVTDNGVVVDLTFTFSTNVGTMSEGSRLGIDNAATNVGGAGNNAINAGEILTITVVPTVTSIPVGVPLYFLDFGISGADFVRHSGGSGNSAHYEWNSNAASYTSPGSTTAGAQPAANEVLDGSSLHSISFPAITTPYVATFETFHDTAAANTSGFRFVTSAANIDFTLIAIIPEPSRALLLLFGTIGMIFRRSR